VPFLQILASLGSAATLAANAAIGNPAEVRTDVLRATPHSVAIEAYHRMTPHQRVGQLFMAGVTSSGASKPSVRFLGRHAVGNVVLYDHTSKRLGAVRHDNDRLVGKLRVAGVAPYISTDQEGGVVQRLSGTGFTRIPSAVHQGMLADPALKAATTRWGRQLLKAGVSLDLAPVADVVPAHRAHSQPIGYEDREYGHTPGVVTSHVVAFERGLHQAGVVSTLKHFPGLGRASGNTDLSSRVSDPTTRHDRYLRPFRAGIEAGARVVMVSSAFYPSIGGSRPACFSARIITGMLRSDLHFKGVVLSDDLGTAAWSQVPVGARATRFFKAGGTLLLDTQPKDLPTMVRAVRARAHAHPAFAAALKAAVLTNLRTKAATGLIRA
jgi:beta-N-acetylhexosaminidase